MKLNNKGFALTSIIYMLIVMFVLVIVLVLSNLAQRKVILDKMKYDVKQKLNQGGVVSQNKYIISFNPNGGEVSQEIKQVTYNKQYGTLPTPTRTNYSFAGWTGKNLFNMQEWITLTRNATNGAITKSANSITLSATSDGAYTNSLDAKIEVRPEETYTLSWTSDNNTTGGNVYVYINDKQITDYMFSASHTEKKLTFETPIDAEYISIKVGVTSTNGTITYSNIQLEQGENATAYEPYQVIEEETTVTNLETHTLYAKWDIPYTKYYTDLSYIQTDGNQYTILDYMAKTNTEIRLDIQFIDNGNTEVADCFNNIIGHEQNSNDNARFSINFGNGSDQSKTIYYWVDKKFDGTNSYSNTYTSVTNRSTFIVKSGTATFQNESNTIETKAQDNTENMVLLGQMNSSANPAGIYGLNRYDTKIYGFKIYEGSTLVKDLTPVKRKGDNKIGLYDKISKSFYTSDGSQDFIEP